jgi:hypothetical protein
LKSTSDDLGGGAGNKGIVVNDGATFDVHGKQYHPTWTKLSASVDKSSNFVDLQDAVNWEPGQSVVVTTTVRRDDQSNQNEIMQIAQVSNGGTRLVFTSAFRFNHHGGREYQAEVALISRRIQFVGASDSDAQAYGGHIMIRSKTARVSGSLFRVVVA